MRMASCQEGADGFWYVRHESFPSSVFCAGSFENAAAISAAINEAFQRGQEIGQEKIRAGLWELLGVPPHVGN